MSKDTACTMYLVVSAMTFGCYLKCFSFDCIRCNFYFLFYQCTSLESFPILDSFLFSYCLFPEVVLVAFDGVARIC